MDEALDLRLREIRARLLETDPLLNHLVGLTTHSDLTIPCVLVLALGTHMVSGVPAPTERFAETVDETFAQNFRVIGAIQASDGGDSKAWFDIADQWLAQAHFTTPARERAEQRRAFWERVDRAGVELTDETTAMPREFWEDAFQATIRPHAVTLQQAFMREPGGSWEPVGTIRVVLRHVTAWWTKPIDVPEAAEAYLPQD